MKNPLHSLSRLGLLFFSFLLLAPWACLAEPQELERLEGTQKADQARSGMKEVQELSDEGKLEEALRELEDVKDNVHLSKKLMRADRLNAKFEKKLAEKEKEKENYIREADKRRKFLEVDTYWQPPQIYEKPLNLEEEEIGPQAPIQIKARRRIPLIDFKDASLKEVVDFLARAADINIVIDEQAVPENDRVSIYLKDIPMIEALNFVLRTKKLSTKIEENLILITRPENLGDDLEVRVYDVQDLIGKLHDFPAEHFDFKDVSKKEEKSGEGGEGGGGAGGG